MLKLYQRFAGDRSGAVAIMFGLTVLILVASSALALDTSRINRMQMRITSALDAAALATARELRLSSMSLAELQTLAANYFDANMRQVLQQEGRIEGFTVDVDRERSAVTLSTVAVLPTSIGRVFNVNEFRMELTASSIYSAKDIELGMMLDVSGSMSGRKIQALRDAAQDLAEIVLDTSHGPSLNKIAIAPYSTAVNADTYAQSATGVRKSHSCVTERTGAQAFTDADPFSAPLGRKTSSCAHSSIFPLTNDLNAVGAQIQSLTDGGMTAGHLGIAWAWYLISPKWESFWPSASAPRSYEDPEVMKAVIIMTDGEFNTAYESSNGNSQKQSQKLCANIKSAGVTVFSVGFEAPNAALTILQQCASKSSYFFDARNDTELRDAFRRIANELTGLRLTM